jgi:hypothetical protein
LVQGWLNAFVLAAQGGMAVDFVRERLDGRLPNPDVTPLLLCPAPLTTCENTLIGLRTTHWQAARDYVEAGGTLYLSCSVATAIPNLADLAGVRILDRAPLGVTDVTFVDSLGSVDAGTTMRFPEAADPVRRGVLFEATDADVIACDREGRPVITMARRGAGSVIACAHPLELLLAERPDDPFEESGCWNLYAALASLSGASLPARFTHHEATSGVLVGEAGGLLVVTNHSPGPLTGTVILPSNARDVRSVLPVEGPLDDGELTIAGHGVLVVTWLDS